MFEWEESWLARDLPRAPARVLLGGAGRGRETRWLIDRGYTVIAFDPAPSSVIQHNAVCPEATCVVLDYESLVRAHHGRHSGSERQSTHDASPVLDGAPYDAALLGWTSLTHVLEEHDQDALFEVLGALVPRGPILASFFFGPRATGSDALGRAYEIGLQLGTALTRPPRGSTLDGSAVQCLPHAGFVYSFEHVRLAQLAQCSHRTLELHLNTYPHATFR